MIRFLASLFVIAVLIASGPAAGQQTAPAAAAESGAAKPVPKMILLPLNKAEIFELPVDARDVLVANPSVADVVIKTPRQVYVLGQQVGDTNVFFFDDEGREILRLEVRVELDLSGLRQVLAKVLPNERIEVTAANQNIILSGTVLSAKAAEDARLVARRYVADDAELVNMLGIASDQQVLLRVRVAEMRRTVVKQLGINTTVTVLDGGSTIFSLINTAGSFAAPFGTAFTNILSPAHLFDQLQVTIDALEKQGLVKTLAEPTLTAVSGENANLLVGGEFPITVNVTVSAAGQVSQDIEFRQFGIVLTFTPVVLSSGRISLKLSIEVSELETDTAAGALSIDTGGAVPLIIPALTIDRAETTVELPSGGSLVIAGLLQDDIKNTIQGIPGLKDIPILGALFRSTDFQKGETELVIVVTAYLVRAESESAFALPTDGFAPANDLDMYLLGRLHDVYVKPKAADQELPVGRLLGPVGYIME